MTIRFITAWNGNHADQIVSGLSVAEEKRLIALGFAVADLYGPGGNLREIVHYTSTGTVLVRPDSLSTRFYKNPTPIFSSSQSTYPTYFWWFVVDVSRISGALGRYYAYTLLIMTPLLAALLWRTAMIL